MPASDRDVLTPSPSCNKESRGIPRRDTTPPESWLTQLSHQQSHESMRHTFNDRLLCLVTHIPSAPRLFPVFVSAEIRMLQVPVRGQKGTVGTEIETSWLCVWVRVAVSKVLCYVCHLWAGLCHTTTLVSIMTPAPPPPPTPSHHPPIQTHIPLYQRHHWSKTLNALGSESSTTTTYLAYILCLCKLNI